MGAAESSVSLPCGACHCRFRPKQECPTCGAVFVPDASFCHNCGRDRPAERVEPTATEDSEVRVKTVQQIPAIGVAAEFTEEVVTGFAESPGESHKGLTSATTTTPNSSAARPSRMASPMEQAIGSSSLPSATTVVDTSQKALDTNAFFTPTKDREYLKLQSGFGDAHTQESDSCRTQQASLTSNGRATSDEDSLAQHHYIATPDQNQLSQASNQQMGSAAASKEVVPCTEVDIDAADSSVVQECLVLSEERALRPPTPPPTPATPSAAQRAAQSVMRQYVNADAEFAHAANTAVACLAGTWGTASPSAASPARTMGRAEVSEFCSPSPRMPLSPLSIEESPARAPTCGLHANVVARCAVDDLDSVDHEEFMVEGGAMYKGEWHGDIRSGQGVLVEPDGSRYKGAFENGKAHGHGILVTASGAYDGQWDQDRMHGFGQYSQSNGYSYEGEWDYDQKCGHGVEVLSDGARYEGQFLDNLKSGVGMYKSGTGTTYEGQFRSGKPDGEGVHKFADGRVHTGHWKHGHMNGYGKMEWPSGYKYEGMFDNDMKHGEGRFVWPDGSEYSGQWHKGMQHGSGVTVHANGERAETTWSKGRRLDNPSENWV